MAPSRTCDETREALWPDPERGGGPADAQAHYEACRSCRQFFVRDRRLGERLARISRTAAPDALRARMQKRIRQDRRRMFGTWAGAGAVALAATLVILVLGRRPDMRRMAAPFATAARATDSASLAMPTNSPAALDAWFSATLGGNVNVPAIAGAELVGGKIETISGRPAAVALYRMHGDPLTWIAVPDSAGGAGVMGRDIRMAETDGLRVALWREPGGLRAVAAAMPQNDVMAVATECRARATSGRP